MNQNLLKQQVAKKAVEYIRENISDGLIIGVGTGSTVNFFIDELAQFKSYFKGAISSSERTKIKLEENGIHVYDANEVISIPIYVDGADEIDLQGNMIKGGGAAHTREKICAAMADQFMCIADVSKQVSVLGKFPLPIEVVPLAREAVARQLVELGGQVVWRKAAYDLPLVTDNSCHILDVHGLNLTEPLAWEIQLTMIPGVLTVGIFAQHPADLALIATNDGVIQIDF